MLMWRGAIVCQRVDIRRPRLAAFVITGPGSGCLGALKRKVYGRSAPRAGSGSAGGNIVGKARQSRPPAIRNRSCPVPSRGPDSPSDNVTFSYPTRPDTERSAIFSLTVSPKRRDRRRGRPVGGLKSRCSTWLSVFLRSHRGVQCD